MNRIQIANTNINMQGRLVPLKDYKGLTLKLSEQEKAKIADIKKVIETYNCDIIRLEEKCRRLPICRLKNQYIERISYLDDMVKDAENCITEIKKKRLQIQKAEAGQNIDIQV